MITGLGAAGPHAGLGHVCWRRPLAIHATAVGQHLSSSFARPHRFISP